MALRRLLTDPCESCRCRDDHLWCLPSGWVCDACYADIARRLREELALLRATERARRRALWCWRLAAAVTGLIVGGVLTWAKYR